ncbi:MAG: PKD domain-containing protein [Desulfobacterales bacterium]
MTDDSGDIDTDVAVVNVGIGNLPPVADAGEIVSGTVGSSITFDGTGSSDPEGSVDQYTWDFGDDTPVLSGLANPTHNLKKIRRKSP